MQILIVGSSLSTGLFLIKRLAHKKWETEGHDDPKFNSAHFEWRSVTSVFTNQTNIEE